MVNLKNNILKIIEQPSAILESTRGLSIAKYDLLFAKQLCKKPFKFFVDVGSACGEYTYTFKKMFPGAKVYSFEPIPELHNKLPNYRPIKLALWEREERLGFTIAKDARGSSIIHGMSKGHVIEIITRRFDCLNIHINQPALLKVDVEGAEFEVLKGFGNQLSKFDVVIVEVNMDKNNHSSKVISLMERNGFYRFIQKDLREGYGQSNLFFIKEGINESNN